MQRRTTLMRKVSLAIALAGSLLLPAPGQAQSGSVKAALVYNIIRFINFPDNPSRIRICSIAGQSINGDLRALNGRAVGSSRIEVVFVATPRDAGSSCDVIYLQGISPSALAGIGRGQVVIGEGANFVDRGGTIGLVNFGGQVRFAINSRVAKASGVMLSSQLMQLAAKVVS